MANPNCRCLLIMHLGMFLFHSVSRWSKGRSGLHALMQTCYWGRCEDNYNVPFCTHWSHLWHQLIRWDFFCVQLHLGLTSSRDLWVVKMYCLVGGTREKNVPQGAKWQHQLVMSIQVYLPLRECLLICTWMQSVCYPNSSHRILLL